MWTWIRRGFFFFGVNALIILTLSISLNLASHYFGIQIEGYTGYLVLYSFLGMGGAFISLFMSKGMAKRSMGLQMITSQSRDAEERWILERVHYFAKVAKLPKMPEVGVYNSQEVNAFATGPSKSNSLVAVSTGLMNRMDRNQVEGVLAHEVAHIANGDMMTMTLLQGLMNTMVLFISSILASMISNAMRGENGRGGGFFMRYAIYTIVQIPLSLLGSILVNFFSRAREFRADAGSAKYAGRDKMIAALEALKGSTQLIDPKQQKMASLKISGQRSKFTALFSTHPSLDDRIHRLQRARL